MEKRFAVDNDGRLAKGNAVDAVDVVDVISAPFSALLNHER